MRPPVATALHFDRRAEAYAAFRRRWPIGWLQQEEERALHRLAEVQPQQRVLDVGCGAGTTLAWLRERRARAVGVDLSRRMAEACRRAGHDVCVQDMQRLGLREAFDWVLCIGSLEFASDPEGALRGFAACFKPGGSLVLLFLWRGPLGSLYRLYHRVHGVRIRVFRSDEIAQVLAASGLGRPNATIDCRLSSLCRAART